MNTTEPLAPISRLLYYFLDSVHNETRGETFTDDPRCQVTRTTAATHPELSLSLGSLATLEYSSLYRMDVE